MKHVVIWLAGIIIYLLIVTVQVQEMTAAIDKQTEAIHLLTQNQLLILKRQRTDVVQKLKTMKEKGESRNAVEPQE